MYIIDSRTSAIPKINKFYSGLNSNLAYSLQKSGFKVMLKKVIRKIVDQSLEPSPKVSFMGPGRSYDIFDNIT
ncbi:hypothetical protein EO93_16715 [Methanosarcina sp. 1.H.A.2.2]|nr:hypothetical protein EO93_16715 [Methanosarcina sp. 1.H.A.2.2]